MPNGAIGVSSREVVGRNKWETRVKRHFAFGDFSQQTNVWTDHFPIICLEAHLSTASNTKLYLWKLISWSEHTAEVQAVS